MTHASTLAMDLAAHAVAVVTTPMTAAFLVEATLLGLVAGWAADRIGDNCAAFLEQGAGAALRASYCQRCHSPPPWWLHLPLLGPLLAHHRCPTCGLGLHGLRRPLELVGAIACAAPATVMGPSPQALAVMLAAALLLACLATDLYASVIPQPLTAVALWLGLLAAVTGVIPLTTSDAIVGAAAGWIGLRVVQAWGLWSRGSVSLGDGDLNLLAVGGAWGGLAGVSYALVIGAALAIAHTLYNHARERTAGADKPFGPWLAFGIWLVLLVPPMHLLHRLP